VCIAANEPPLRDPESAPRCFERYRELLAAEAPVEACELGLIWTFPENLRYEHRAVVVASGTTAGHRLVRRFDEPGMPETLIALGFGSTGGFWPPW